MEKLALLFKLFQISREQSQYGYILSGIMRHELSNLAEHSYLVTINAWLLGRKCIANGANLDLLKIIELALIHDIGEIMGGDIHYYYGRKNK